MAANTRITCLPKHDSKSDAWSIPEDTKKTGEWKRKRRRNSIEKLESVRIFQQNDKRKRKTINAF